MLACAAFPDANCATTRPARKIEGNRSPPIVTAISDAVAPESLNALPGWAGCVVNATATKMAPDA